MVQFPTFLTRGLIFFFFLPHLPRDWPVPTSAMESWSLNPLDRQGSPRGLHFHCPLGPTNPAAGSGLMEALPGGSLLGLRPSAEPVHPVAGLLDSQNSKGITLPGRPPQPHNQSRAMVSGTPGSNSGPTSGISKDLSIKYFWISRSISFFFKYNSLTRSWFLPYSFSPSWDGCLWSFLQPSKPAPHWVPWFRSPLTDEWWIAQTSAVPAMSQDPSSTGLTESSYQPDQVCTSHCLFLHEGTES